MWTMAAPALAASMQDWAISAGETGTAALRLGESAEPVTAQEIMTLRCIRGGFLMARTAPIQIGRHQGFFRFGPAGCPLAGAGARGKWILMYHVKFGPAGQTKAVLPPMLHCAKPPCPRPWSESAISRGQIGTHGTRHGGRGMGRVSD